MMRVGFGDYRHLTVDRLMLASPSYVLWMFRQENPFGMLPDARQEARRLIGVFDSIPFTKTCDYCDKAATQCLASFCGGKLALNWLCDTDHWGAAHNQTSVGSYMSAAYFALMAQEPFGGLDRWLVNELARAKNIPLEILRRSFFSLDYVVAELRKGPAAFEIFRRPRRPPIRHRTQC